MAGVVYGQVIWDHPKARSLLDLAASSLLATSGADIIWQRHYCPYVNIAELVDSPRIGILDPSFVLEDDVLSEVQTVWQSLLSPNELMDDFLSFPTRNQD